MSDETPAATHNVFFIDGDKEIGPVGVIVMEEREEDADLLEAAAVANNAIANNMQIYVQRIADKEEAYFTPDEAKDWWA